MQRWGTSAGDTGLRGQPGQCKGGDSIDQDRDAGGEGTGPQRHAQQLAKIW